MSRRDLLVAAVALIEDEGDNELDDTIALASIVSAQTDRSRSPYCNKVIDFYFDFEVKRLFRLSREMRVEVAGQFKASAFYPYPVGGRQQVSAEKTLLIMLRFGHASDDVPDC